MGRGEALITDGGDSRWGCCGNKVGVLIGIVAFGGVSHVKECTFLGRCAPFVECMLLGGSLSLSLLYTFSYGYLL